MCDHPYCIPTRAATRWRRKSSASGALRKWSTQRITPNATVMAAVSAVAESQIGGRRRCDFMGTWARAPYHARVLVLLRKVLGRPLLWWGIAAAMFVRDVVYTLIPNTRPDAFSVVQAGYRWLHDPAAIYAGTAKHLHDTGLVPVIGLIRPPAVAMLGAPFTVLPASWQVPAFTIADAGAAGAGAWVGEKIVTRLTPGTTGVWGVGFFSPPLFAAGHA